MSGEINPYQSPTETISIPGVRSSPSLESFRPAGTLALIVVGLLGFHIVLDVAASGMSLVELSYYNEGTTFDEAILDDATVVFLVAFGALGLLQLLAVIVTAIFFCIWNYRVYKNLLGLGVPRLQHAASWAAGSWFVPILNLFRPYQIMQEIWKGSDPENVRKEGHLYIRPRGSTLVGWWWAAWIIGDIIDTGALRLELQGDGDLDLLKMSAIATIVGSAISIACAVMAIVIVRGIHANQEERARLVSETAPYIAPDNLGGFSSH